GRPADQAERQEVWGAGMDRAPGARWGPTPPLPTSPPPAYASRAYLSDRLFEKLHQQVVRKLRVRLRGTLAEISHEGLHGLFPARAIVGHRLRIRIDHSLCEHTHLGRVAHLRVRVLRDDLCRRAPGFDRLREYLASLVLRDASIDHQADQLGEVLRGPQLAARSALAADPVGRLPGRRARGDRPLEQVGEVT